MASNSPFRTKRTSNDHRASSDVPLRKWSAKLASGWLAFILLLGIAGEAHTQHEHHPGAVIRQIRIVRHDVFPDGAGKPAFVYQLANALHMVTRPGIIRRELLFQEGELFDSELAAESERRLRNLPFLGQVEISAAPAGGDSVDIEITTHDQWSTLTSAIIAGGGGRATYGGAVEEFNLLGFGKQLLAEASHEREEGTTWTFRYRDPQFAGSRWLTDASVVTGPFVDLFSASLLRPFFSPDTRWSWGISGGFSDRNIREFSAGSEVNRFRREVASFAASAENAFGRRYAKSRVRLRYRYQNRDFSELPGATTALPQSELLHLLDVRLQRENRSFAEETHLDRFSKIEDVTLGSLTSVTLARSGLIVPRGIRRFELLIERQQGYRLSDEQYLFFGAAFSTYFDKETVLSSRLRYYNQVAGWQTLACNVEFNYARNTEVVPFLLGGDSGLRGFPARQFAGDRRLLVNLEDRLFTPITVLTVALGGVAFVDAGHVWQVSEPMALREINLSAGLGLRLGYTKSPNSRVGRIDFAWPIRGGGGFGITVGIDQQFSID